MKPISVIISTANRPKFLEEALSSVARQTALNDIEEVIVSENGGNRESQAVCAKFKSLPIKYIFQDPPISALEHGNVLVRQARAEFIAVLHDDDWWTPEHLARSLEALRSNPGCVATYSNFYNTEGQNYPFSLIQHAWIVWVASGCDFNRPVLFLDEAAVMFACLAWTTPSANFHYSTLVGRADAVRNAVLRILATGNCHDNDRQVPVFLSLHGKVCYLTTPDIFVRFHRGNDALTFGLRSDAAELTLQTTRWLMENSPGNLAKARDLFNKAAQGMDPGKLLAISNLINNRLRSMLIEECGFKLIPAKREPYIERLARQICPPIMWGLMRWLIKQCYSVFLPIALFPRNCFRRLYRAIKEHNE